MKKPKSYWHYGLVKHDDCVAVHEIYVDPEGVSWTKSPVGFIGENKEEILKILKMVVRDIKKYEVIEP